MDSKPIHISGDKSAFLSKNALLRFKEDLRANDATSSYFREGWTYHITSSTATEIHVELKQIEKDNGKNKAFMKLKLNEMKNKRMSEDQVRLKLSKTVPSDLIDQYINLKKISKIPVLHPNDVLRSAEYKPILQQLLTTYGTSGNPVSYTHLTLPTKRIV